VKTPVRTLVITIPDRGTLRHPLTNSVAAACRIVEMLAPHVPPDGTWTTDDRWREEPGDTA
jgi:hypothetical protein